MTKLIANLAPVLVILPALFSVNDSRLTTTTQQKRVHVAQQTETAAPKLWQGKKAAIVLTYDDALDVHLDKAIPALDSLGFKGAFYLSAAFPGSKNRISDWKKAAMKGHELGNHTLFHPCDGSKPGRSWVSPQNDLSKYTTD